VNKNQINSIAIEIAINISALNALIKVILDEICCENKLVLN
jgi:hypothetical protein